MALFTHWQSSKIPEVALNSTVVFTSAHAGVGFCTEFAGRGLCCVVLYGRGVITYCTAMLFHSVLALIKPFHLR